jgi:hypothetical protein
MVAKAQAGELNLARTIWGLRGASRWGGEGIPRAGQADGNAGGPRSTRRDLARAVDRHTADAEKFTVAMAKVEASPELVPLGVDGRGQDRFTTPGGRRRVLEAEKRIERQVVLVRQTERNGEIVIANTGRSLLRALRARPLPTKDQQRARASPVQSRPQPARGVHDRQALRRRLPV